jgi:outer membrane protein OmpA-like peptidoglycan-associated protein
MTSRSLKTALKKIAAVATTTAMTATGLVALSVAVTIPNVLPTHAAGLGGPVQLDGMDPVCHSTGESTGQYIAAVLKSLHDTATISGNDGSIAILGTGISNGCNASFDATASNDVDNQYLNGFAAGSKPAWSLHSDATAINAFFADLAAGVIHPKVIWLPDDWDRDTAAEQAFADNAEGISNFVNAGGGLFANYGSYQWLSALLPGAQFVNGGCNGGPALSTDGQNAFPSLTNAMVEACWHGSFWGSYPGLVSLVEWPFDALNTGATPTPMAPVAIGGANVTLPSAFKLMTNPGQAIHSDTVDVIASAIGLDGTIYSGVSVSFSITSGPHAGWTASATTGSDGHAHASLTFATDGTDVIVATATVNGTARSQTYNLDWASAFAPTRFTDSVLGAMYEGTPFANGIAADGRPAPTYAVTAGSLPAGLSLNPTTGAITGTPTAVASFSFEITATNVAGSIAKTFTGSTSAGAPTPPTWTDSAIADMTEGVAFSDSVAAAGSPAPTYSVSSGSLPAGLSLDSTTGAITGTPTSTGLFAFVITASNTGGSITESFSGSVSEAAAAPTWSDVILGSFSKNISFSDDVAASGNPAPTYSITAGELPAGISLDPSTGAITGTPTDEGSYSFEVTATNASGSISQVFSGSTADSTPVWSDITIADFALAVSYSNGVAASSSRSITYSITAGALPAGISLDPSTGALTGTPTAAGAYSFEVTATASGTSPELSVSNTFSGDVEDTTPFWFDSTLGDIYAGIAYSDSLTGSSSIAVTYAVTAGALPVGLSLDPSTGAITGTVDAPGAYSFEITVTSDGGSASRTFSGSVIATPPTFTDGVVAGGVTAVAYTDGVSATAPTAVTYAVTAGALPAGLSLDPTTGAITGTPTTPGSYSFTITASALSGSADVTVTIVVAALTFEPKKDTVNTGTESGSLDFSSAPAGSSFSVTPPKATDNNVAGTVAVSGTTVSFTPSAGFSGYAKVVVTISINGYSENREYTFTVNPAPVYVGSFTPVQETRRETAWLNSPRALSSTVITWNPSPNAIGYEVEEVASVGAAGVRAKGVVALCTTTATSCALNSIAGPGLTYQVVALGRDGLRSIVSKITYEPKRGTRGLKTLFSQFSTDSFKLSAVAKAELRLLAAQAKKAGYTTVLLTGNTDERGSKSHNAWLSQQRANAVKAYLATLLPGVKIKTLALGKAEPAAKGKTNAARSLNRRVDIYLS